MTSGNESKVHGMKNGKVESKMQGNKEKNVNKSKSSEDVDESFSVDAIATEDIFPVNQMNDCILHTDSLGTCMYKSHYGV